MLIHGGASGRADERMSMKQEKTDRMARSSLLPLCGGIAAASLVVMSLWSRDDFWSQWPGMLGFFAIGVLVTAIIGIPLLFLVERWIRLQGRYVVGGALYGLIFWILVDAPIFPRDWPRLLERWFWISYAPPRVAAFVAFGAVFGVIYTALLWLAERCLRH